MAIFLDNHFFMMLSISHSKSLFTFLTTLSLITSSQEAKYGTKSTQTELLQELYLQAL
jgi:hypothetical protein